MRRLSSIIVGLFGVGLLGAMSTVGWARQRTPFVGWLVFEMNDGTTQQLYLIEAEGTDLRQLSSGDKTIWEYPQWSPDGSWILAAENTSHRMVALRPYGQGVMQPLETGNFASITMRWSPDSDQIVYTSFFERYMNVHVAFVYGDTSTRLTNFGEYRNGDAMWSPDGTRLAFLSNRDDLTEIYQMDRNGDNLKRRTEDSHVQTLIGWSPDGEGVYFLNYLNTIVFGRMDGTNLQKMIVQEQGRIAAAELSPDGEWLVYVTLYREGIHQERQAFLMRTDGRERHQILRDYQHPDDFVWSPDGKWIAFTAEVEGFRQLFRAKADGTTVQQLTFDRRNHSRPDWSPLIDKGWSWNMLPLILVIFGVAMAAHVLTVKH